MPQSARRRDLLLDIVRAALTVAMALAVAITTALVTATLALLLWPRPMLEVISQHMGLTFPPGLVLGVAGVLGLIAVTSVLGLRFFLLLRRIIDSVADGDPFIPENAVRLKQMGWLSVTVQLIAIPVSVLSGWISYMSHINRFDVGMSIGGILLALILFVLARVFRKGAAMRDELEGTV